MKPQWYYIGSNRFSGRKCHNILQKAYKKEKKIGVGYYFRISYFVEPILGHKEEEYSFFKKSYSNSNHPGLIITQKPMVMLFVYWIHVKFETMVYICILSKTLDFSKQKTVQKDQNKTPCQRYNQIHKSEPCSCYFFIKTV